MSTVTCIAIVPRQRMRDFCARHGGFSWKAAEEISGLDRDGDGEILKRKPRAGEIVRDDGRDGRSAYLALQFAYAGASSDDKDPLLVTLSFYWPVAGVAYPFFDDSGGGVRSCGPVLGPVRCKHLLDCWRGVDPERLPRVLDNCASLWDATSREHCRFEDGKVLTEYLAFYAGCLEEAIGRDAFYTISTA